MHIGRTRLQSGQPFQPDSDSNTGYLQPSWYLGVGSDKRVDDCWLLWVFL